MDTTIAKSSVSIRIDSVLLKQLREEAQNENRSLSNYLETILYRVYHMASGGDNGTIAPSLELKAKILDGSINKSTFTDTQLEQIMKGKDKIIKSNAL